jgi:hypothetical protein
MAKAKIVKIPKPAHPRGWLMGEVAQALLQRFEYGSILNYDDFEKLLINSGRQKPTGASGRKLHEWMHQERYALNAFGRNIELLLTLGIIGIEHHGFSVSPLHSTQGGGFRLLTVWGDMLSRDRPREAALKQLKVAKDHAVAQPFCPADDPVAQRFIKRQINKQTEIMREFERENSLRVQMIHNENDRSSRTRLIKKKDRA